MNSLKLISLELSRSIFENSCETSYSNIYWGKQSLNYASDNTPSLSLSIKLNNRPKLLLFSWLTLFVSKKYLKKSMQVPLLWGKFLVFDSKNLLFLYPKKDAFPDSKKWCEIIEWSSFLWKLNFCSISVRIYFSSYSSELHFLCWSIS